MFEITMQHSAAARVWATCLLEVDLGQKGALGRVVYPQVAVQRHGGDQRLGGVEAQGADLWGAFGVGVERVWVVGKWKRSAAR